MEKMYLHTIRVVLAHFLHLGNDRPRCTLAGILLLCMDDVRGSQPLLEEPRFLLGGSDTPRHLDSVVLKSKACLASLRANNKARASGNTDGEGLVGREIVAERGIPPGHHLDG
jgi:hypothetical protein